MSRFGSFGERVWDSGDSIAQLKDDSLFVYDESGRLLGEYTYQGLAVQEVIWLDDLPVATLRSATAYPIESDHLGSPRVVAQGSTLLWQWDLLGPVFGEHAPNDTAAGKLFRFDLRFPGQQYDAASGLNYNYFRDYEAGTGRYVESDPIGLGGGISTFGYVGSMPLLTFDRTGLAGNTNFGVGLDCLMTYGFDTCNQARKCGNEAYKHQKKVSPGERKAGGRGDAQRHCFLSCCLTFFSDAVTAKGLLDMYEDWKLPPLNRMCERLQDFYNNDVGINLGKEKRVSRSARGHVVTTHKCDDCESAPTNDDCDNFIGCY